MESRLIYESHKAYFNKVDWKKSARDSEWIYFDNTENIDKHGIQKIISDYFFEEKLYLIISRNESKQIEKDLIVNQIMPFFKTHNFLLWNESFNKVIEFNKVGIFRKGFYASR